ncbi:MAG: UDP-N-acetylmuramoylalanyl-D-glutamate--2,6-diaminopimelate ligase [Eggerthellaceae bacterium]|nr:UDP-N-acetylmuramoylalanyl-D-glutamate--2,6-diaminopimelate ligase [Eggerthellaceae bacterium]
MPVLACPSCGERNLDLRAYDSLMVLRSDLAFFSLRCPRCSKKISTLQPIPSALREEVRFAAIEVGAGMGLD